MESDVGRSYICWIEARTFWAFASHHSLFYQLNAMPFFAQPHHARAKNSEEWKTILILIMSMSNIQKAYKNPIFFVSPKETRFCFFFLLLYSHFAALLQLVFVAVHECMCVATIDFVPNIRNCRDQIVKRFFSCRFFIFYKTSATSGLVVAFYSHQIIIIILLAWIREGDGDGDSVKYLCVFKLCE